MRDIVPDQYVCYAGELSTDQRTNRTHRMDSILCGGLFVQRIVRAIHSAGNKGEIARRNYAMVGHWMNETLTIEQNELEDLKNYGC